MGSPDHGNLPVDLDEADQQGCGFDRRVAVRNACKLVQVVPDPGQLPKQGWINGGRGAAFP